MAKILCIEPDLKAASQLQKQLYPLDMTLAENTASGLYLLRREHYEVILINMDHKPFSEQKQVLMALREIPGYSTTPIFLFRENQIVTTKEHEALDVSGYFQKPVSDRDLMMAIREALFNVRTQSQYSRSGVQPV